jgi:hypothetical protein
MPTPQSLVSAVKLKVIPSCTADVKVTNSPGEVVSTLVCSAVLSKKLLTAAGEFEGEGVCVAVDCASTSRAAKNAITTRSKTRQDVGAMQYVMSGNQDNKESVSNYSMRSYFEDENETNP